MDRNIQFMLGQLLKLLEIVPWIYYSTIMLIIWTSIVLKVTRCSTVKAEAADVIAKNYTFLAIQCWDCETDGKGQICQM